MKIVSDIDDFFTYKIEPKSYLIRLIINTRLIIWDEALMMYKYYFQDVDNFFLEIFLNLPILIVKLSLEVK